MSNPNYPDGINNLPWDKKDTPINVTVELDGLHYDDGYGEKDCTLVVDCKVTGDEIECSDGMFFLYGNGGVELGEVKYEYNETGKGSQYDSMVYEEAMRLAQKERDCGIDSVGFLRGLNPYRD